MNEFLDLTLPPCKEFAISALRNRLDTLPPNELWDWWVLEGLDEMTQYLNDYLNRKNEIKLQLKTGKSPDMSLEAQLEVTKIKRVMVSLSRDEYIPWWKNKGGLDTFLAIKRLSFAYEHIEAQLQTKELSNKN